MATQLCHMTPTTTKTKNPSPIDDTIRARYGFVAPSCLGDEGSSPAFGDFSLKDNCLWVTSTWLSSLQDSRLSPWNLATARMMGKAAL